MQEFANTHSMRNEILSLMAQNGLEDDCYLEMLDYTIDLWIRVKCRLLLIRD